jgi:hypothetical protein
MKILFALLALSIPSWASITVAQSVASAANCSSGSTTSCAITVSSTTSGNGAVFCIQISGGTASAPSTGGTWTVVPNLNGVTIGPKIVYCWYNLSISSGLTSISSTIGTSGDARAATFLEVHSSLSGSSWAFDSAPSFSTDNSCTSCNVQPSRLTGTTNDVVYSSITGAQTISAVSSNYSGIVPASSTTYATSYATNVTAVNAPTGTWTVGTSSTNYVWSVSLTEVPANATVTMPALVM